MVDPGAQLISSDQASLMLKAGLLLLIAGALGGGFSLGSVRVHKLGRIAIALSLSIGAALAYLGWRAQVQLDTRMSDETKAPRPPPPDIARIATSPWITALKIPLDAHDALPTAFVFPDAKWDSDSFGDVLVYSTKIINATWETREYVQDGLVRGVVFEVTIGDWQEDQPDGQKPLEEGDMVAVNDGCAGNAYASMRERMTREFGTEFGAPRVTLRTALHNTQFVEPTLCFGGPTTCGADKTDTTRTTAYDFSKDWDVALDSVLTSITMHGESPMDRRPYQHITLLCLWRVSVVRRGDGPLHD
jgi:hypothetical protein